MNKRVFTVEEVCAAIEDAFPDVYTCCLYSKRLKAHKDCAAMIRYVLYYKFGLRCESLCFLSDESSEVTVGPCFQGSTKCFLVDLSAHKAKSPHAFPSSLRISICESLFN